MQFDKSDLNFKFKVDCKRALQYQKELPKIEDYIAAINESDGFCLYCGEKLLGSGQSNFVFSIDHNTPLACWNGTDEKDNLIVCCQRCNLIKGTMHGSTYRKFIMALKNAEIFDIVSYEMLFGRRKAVEKS